MAHGIAPLPGQVVPGIESLDRHLYRSSKAEKDQVIVDLLRILRSLSISAIGEPALLCYITETDRYSHQWASCCTQNSICSLGIT